jgi:predicted ABC-type transport system involved in lysophospholipase L1 biosynthesis ATPase subunit
LVTHDQAVADAASRIVTMRDGRIEGVTTAGAAPAPVR